MKSQHFRSAYVPHDIKEHLVGEQDGELSGLLVSVKDMFDIAGERTGGGSPSWLQNHQPATRNSAVVDQLLAAGATINGKTICDEFFYSVSGANAHYGTPLNPRAPSRIPGGSSSGSASAASAGTCDIAIGSDTGGSVRVPAALCGVYGIRTSRGRMDLRGAMSMAPSFDAGGWFAASPGAFSLAGKVLLNNYQDTPASINKIAVAADAFELAEGPIAAMLKGFMQRTAPVIPVLSEINVAGDDIDRWREALRMVQAFEVWKSFGPFIQKHAPQLGPGIAERMSFASTVGEEDVRGHRDVLAEVTDRLEEATAGGTVLVLPTCPSIAPEIDTPQEDLEEFRVNAMRLVCLASISGLPQVTVPVGTINGAPVGLSFIGWRNGDEALLQLAGRVAPYLGVTA